MTRLIQKVTKKGKDVYGTAYPSIQRNKYFSVPSIRLSLSGKSNISDSSYNV